MSDDIRPRGKRQVLVVDDNRVMVDVIRFNLEASGLVVSVARSGDEAWQRLQDDEFDFLVTDYQMPGFSGEELCRKIRQETRFSGLPIVLLSAKGLELDATKLQQELGLREIMFKPFSPRQLVQTIHDCLDQEVAAN